MGGSRSLQSESCSAAGPQEAAQGGAEPPAAPAQGAAQGAAQGGAQAALQAERTAAVAASNAAALLCDLVSTGCAGEACSTRFLHLYLCMSFVTRSIYLSLFCASF